MGDAASAPGGLDGPGRPRIEPATGPDCLDTDSRRSGGRDLHGTEFGSVPLRDGRTGADLLNELYTDKRFLPYLETPTAIWTGPLTGKVQPGNYAQRDTTAFVPSYLITVRATSLSHEKLSGPTI